MSALLVGWAAMADFVGLAVLAERPAEQSHLVLGLLVGLEQCSSGERSGLEEELQISKAQEY